MKTKVIKHETPRLTLAILLAISALVANECVAATPGDKLLKAARVCNAKKAAALIPKVKSYTVAAALNEAAAAGCLNVVQVLVGQGVDINGATAHSQLSPGPHQAAKMRSVMNLVNCWLQGRGYQPHIPLCAAARSGQLETVKWLVRHGADVNLQEEVFVAEDVHTTGQGATAFELAQQRLGPSALAVAVSVGQTAVAKFLAENGAHWSASIQPPPSIPSIYGFGGPDLDHLGVGVLLRGTNGIYSDSSHLWVGEDGVIHTTLPVILRPAITINKMVADSTVPGIRQLMHHGSGD